MMQDPWWSRDPVAKPAQPQAAQTPFWANDPVAQDPALRQQPRPQSRATAPQPAQAAPPSQIAEPTISGLSIDESVQALMQQGYSADDALRLSQEQQQRDAQAAPSAFRAGQIEVGDPVATEPRRFRGMSPDERMALQQGDEVIFDLPGGGEEIRRVAAPPSVGVAEGREVMPGVYVRDVNPAALAEVERLLGEQRSPGVSGMRELTQGLSFGFGDELEAAFVEAQTRGENFNRRILGEEIPYTSREVGSLYAEALRGDQEQFRERRPVTSTALNLIGGLGAPGAGAAGRYIQGGEGAGRIARAGAVGGGYGAAYGAGGSEGSLADRAPDAAMGGLVGAGAGAVMQRVLGGAGRVREPSAQRQLSREGVDLTLGQMLEPTPVIGGAIRATEDRLAGLPLVGDVIQGARMRTLESANTAGVNRALSPIGERVGKKTAAGFDAIEEAQDKLGAAYEDVLSRVSLRLEPQIYDDISKVTNEAAADMGADRARQLAEILRTRVFRNTDDAGATLDGKEFKRIETALGQQQRQLSRSLDADQQALGRAIGDVRGVFRDALARQNPVEAPRLQDINRGYANLVRMEEAAGATGSMQRGGVATPAQIASAVRRTTGTRSQRGRGAGLMADFAQNMGTVIPSQVPDSGTTGRGVLAAVLAGGGAVLKPEIAVPIIAAAGPYTKAGQTLLNVIYRATDSDASRQALARLGQLAQRDPALLPYYEAAVQQVLPDAQNPTQENRRAQQ